MRNWKRVIWGVAGMALSAGAALAQSGGVNYYSSSQLQNMVQALQQQVRSTADGSAGETLEKYPNHFTMLTVRTTSGGAELHEDFADIFVVLDGDALLTTGGTMLNPKNIGPGETRGTAVEDGVQHKLAKGDIVHISANTPHQLTLAPGHSLSYFVIKVRERGSQSDAK